MKVGGSLDRKAVCYQNLHKVHDLPQCAHRPPYVHTNFTYKVKIKIQQPCLQAPWMYALYI